MMACDGRGGLLPGGRGSIVSGSAMMREEVEPSRFRYTSEDATMDLWAPLSCRPRIVIIRIEGHAREEVLEPLLSTLEGAMRLGPVIAFDDWEGVTGYDSAVRVRMTAWTRRFSGGIVATHILMGSRILSMGVSLASRAADLPVTVYDERSEFERVLRAHFPPYRSANKRSSGAR
jgi:hypothetical protein